MTALKRWLEDAVYSSNEFEFSTQKELRPKVLALGGCSGNGKSTMLDLLCDRMNIECIRWSFNNWTGDYASSSVVGYREGYNDDSTSVEIVGEKVNMGTSYRSASAARLEEFDDFVIRSAYPSLNFLSTQSSSRDTRTFLGKRSHEDIHEKNESTSNVVSKTWAGRIIVMEDPPHIIGCSTQHQESFLRSLLEFREPIVMIISEEEAKEDMHHCKNRYFPHDFLNSVNYQSIFCPQITNLKVKKTLESILLAEKFKMTSHMGALLDEISQESHGDLRHAITRLQLLFGQVQRDPKKNKYSNLNETKNVNRKKTNFIHSEELHQGRDSSFSSLHSVSKLLSARLDCNAQINIFPDKVIESSDFPHGIMLSFLQGNCVSNLQRALTLSSRVDSSIDERDSNAIAMGQIAQIFHDFSDLDIWWFRQFDSSKPIDHGETDFPVSYCSAVASRSCAVAKGVGEAERQELAKQAGFKAALVPVHRPKVLDIHQRSTTCKGKLLNIRQALSTANTPSISNACKHLLDLNEISSTVVPYLRHFNRFTRPNVHTGKHLPYLSPLLASCTSSMTDPTFSQQDDIVVKQDEYSHFQEVYLLAQDDIEDFSD